MFYNILYGSFIIIFKVEFSAKLGWAVGTNCRTSNVNVLQNSTVASWMCENCSPSVQVNYGSAFTCTGLNSLQKWERTESTFRYTMPGLGPFDVAWVLFTNVVQSICKWHVQLAFYSFTLLDKCKRKILKWTISWKNTLVKKKEERKRFCRPF